ncbi:hypothetical protein HYV43_00130 [Candidatus Micrarchaeota archaeon]|nr:hypothetical protein [Candidatus Micrarchaeota archaeon]
MKPLALALLLAAASFSIYWLVGGLPGPVVESQGAGLVRSGLAWADGNATTAFFLFDSMLPVPVDITIFRRTMPEKVLIWAESDQEKFEAFSAGLASRLSNQSIAVRRARMPDLRAVEPGVLIVAGSAMPSELALNGSWIELLDRGWVVLYSGFALSLMQSDGRIVANPQWPAQRERLGVDFEAMDPVSDVPLSVRRGSSWLSGRGQVVEHGRGALVVFPGLLDASFSGADDAADFYSEFIRQARWTRPLVSFSANATPGRFLFSPAFDGTAEEAWVRIHDLGTTHRRVRWQPPSLRIIHPSISRAKRPFSVSFLSNLSSPVSFELSVHDGTQALHRQALGGFPSGLTWHSKTPTWDLATGDYVLEVSGSDGSKSYSALHLFSHRVQVDHVDSASKTISAHLWAGERPAARTDLQWAGTSIRTDSEGVFRLFDANLSGGPNRRSLVVDGQSLFFEYSVPAGLLSSWPDRLLALGAVGLFCTAWWFKRQAPVRIRLLPPVVHGRRVSVSKEHILRAMANRTRRDPMPLSVREFSSRLHAVLGDPMLVIEEESVRHLLRQAALAGIVVFHGDFVTLSGWYRSDAEALAAVFWKRLADRLILDGWTFRRNGNRLSCRQAGKKMVIDTDPARGRIRRLGAKAWRSLDDGLETAVSHKRG